MNRLCGNLIRILLVNAALGMIPALAALVFAGLSWREFGDWAISGLVYANLIGSICWTIGPRVQASVAERSLWAQLLAVSGAFAAAGLAGSLAGGVLLHWLGLESRIWFAVRIALSITIAFGLLSFAITTLGNRLEAAKSEVRERRLAEESALKMAAEARFVSLESRVRPHFLFNTLNSIAALIRENPAEAERMIERLSALLRYSLDADAAGLVAVGEEMRMVEEYLAIERIRFGERLRYRLDVEESAKILRVPALSVQTLVENSMKYAIGNRREGGEITVTARVISGVLRIEVSDDGPGFEAERSLKPGHGLDLVRRRLESMFGPAASLEIGSRDGLMRVAILAPS